MSYRPPNRLLGALVVVLSFSLAACSSGDGEAATTATVATITTTAPDATTTTAAPAVVPVGQIPPTLDVPYLQQVLDALDVSRGALFRQYKADGGPTLDNMAWLEQLYGDPELPLVRSVWGEIAAGGFAGIYDVPGDPETVVREIVRETRSCVLISTTRSLDAIRAGAPTNESPEAAAERQHIFVGLQARDTFDERTDRNPSAWTMVFDAGMEDGTPPPEVCR